MKMEKTFTADEFYELLHSFNEATVFCGGGDSFLMMKIATKDIKRSRTKRHEVFSFHRQNKEHLLSRRFRDYYGVEEMIFFLSGNSFRCVMSVEPGGGRLETSITSELCDKPIEMDLLCPRIRKRLVIRRLTGLEVVSENGYNSLITR